VTTPLVSIGTSSLELDGLVRAVSDREVTGGAEGAVVSFLGLVRRENAGRRVLYLEYEGYEPLAVKTFERILAEAKDRWPTVRLALHHRLGRLEIGEASVAIAASSPHRSEAYAACRYAIERVKQIAPIWKHEFFEGGSVWVEGAQADPDDPLARAKAERVACA
jgi:molybdopterin synthase catalytic subunit